ncbi:hypothetical protein [Geopseudomonas aromaticivorans]
MSLYPEERRKVVGETWIEEDKIKKCRETPNTQRLTIERTRTRALLLDCGHAIKVTSFRTNKIPTQNTRCTVCEKPAADAYFAARRAQSEKAEGA